MRRALLALAWLSACGTHGDGSGCCDTCVCSVPFAFVPGSLDFGTVPVGQTHQLTVQATDAMGAPLALESLGLAADGGPFLLAEVPTLPAVIDGGASLAFAVVFEPTVAGPEQSATVTAIYIASGATQPQQALLTVTGN